MTAEAWITGEAPNQQIHFKLPSGNKGPQGIQGIKGDTGSPDYWTIVDYGRPDVPSSTPYTLTQLNAMAVGVEYRSLDRPQGAYRWLKTGATGSAAWKCVEGDTGWRQFTDDYLQSGFTQYINNPRYRLRLQRREDTIEWSGWLGRIQEGKAGGSIICNIPDGFIPDNYGAAYGQILSISTEQIVVVTISGGNLVLAYPNRVPPTMGAGVISFTYQTVNPWPTTLPALPA